MWPAESRCWGRSGRRAVQGRAEAALRRGMERAIDDAARAGAINGFEEFALRQVVPRLPAGRLLQAVRDFVNN